MDKCYGLMINEKKQKSNRNRTQVIFSKKAFEKNFQEQQKKQKTAENDKKQQETTDNSSSSGFYQRDAPERSSADNVV